MGRRVSKVRRASNPPPAAPCAYAEHESQVNEVSARIAELLGQICFSGSEAPGVPSDVPHTTDSEGEQRQEEDDDGTLSGSDVEVYGNAPPGKSQWLAQRRLEKLLGRLNLDERDLALGEVCEWLQDRASFARQDLNRLGRLDRECADRGAETFRAAKVLKDQMDKRGKETASSVRGFCEALSNMEASKKESRRQRSAARSRRFSRVSIPSRRGSSSSNRDQVPMTEEQLEAAIEELREQLQLNEVEAREELLELRHMERVRKPSDEDDTVVDNNDTQAEQERWLLILKEEISENETRSRLIRQANDNLHGKVMMGRRGEVIPLSQDAIRITASLQEEVSSALLPELLAQREAEHGEELKLPDEQRLNKTVEECQNMSRKIGTLDALLARLANDSVLEDDIAAQLREIDAGEQPQNTLLHDCLLALEEGVECLDDASDEQEVPVAETGEQQESAKRPKMSKLATQEYHARNQVQASMQECARIHEKIIEATEDTRATQEKMKALEVEDSAVMKLLDTLEDHKSLFKGALAAARHVPVAEQAADAASPSSSPRKLGSSLVSEEKGTPKKSLVSVVAALRRTSTIQKTPLVASEQPEDMSWVPLFLADEDNAYHPKALEEQATAMEAMAEEEMRLIGECNDLEAAMSQKVAEIQDLSRTEHGGVTTEAAGLLTESVKEGHEAIEAFARSLRDLTEVAAKTPPPAEPGLTLEERRRVLEEITGKAASAEADGGKMEAISGGSVPSQARVAVQEAAHLHELNAALLKRLNLEQAELLRRRQVLERRRLGRKREGDLQAEKQEAVESRRVRQHTRALAALRLEIAAAVAQHRRLSEQDPEASPKGNADVKANLQG